MRGKSGPRGFDPEQDARLVGLCLRGEPGAWEALVRRHERLVYAVGRSYRLSDADLADVFQEVFAALVKGLPRLRDARTLVRWVASTTERVARATALRRRREWALSAGDPHEAAARLASAEGPVGADLERLEEQAMVRLALAALPERCRRLLSALYYEDPPPPYGELSRRLGVPVGSLGPTRARCFEKLRAALATLREPERGITRAVPPTSSVESQEPGRSGVRTARRRSGGLWSGGMEGA